MNINFEFNLETKLHAMHFENMTEREFDGLRILLQTIKNESAFIDGIKTKDLSLTQVINGVRKNIWSNVNKGLNYDEK